MPHPPDTRGVSEHSFEDADMKTLVEKIPGSNESLSLLDDFDIHHDNFDAASNSVQEPLNSHFDSLDDNKSHASSTSDCSLRVSISDPEPPSSLAVLKRVQRLKQSSDHHQFNQLLLFSPSNRSDFDSREDLQKTDNAYGSSHPQYQDSDQCRDNYVQSAARFRSLLDDSFRRTINGYNTAGAFIMGESDGQSEGIIRDKPKRRKTRYSEPIDDPSRRSRLNLMFRDVNTEVNDTPNKIANESITAALLKEKVSEILMLQKVSFIHLIQKV